MTEKGMCVAIDTFLGVEGRQGEVEGGCHDMS